MTMIEIFLNNKKVTVHQVQKLCGFLNFLCRSVVPGRAFTRRLYAMYTVKGRTLLPHHHVKVREENRSDLLIWKRFLSHPNVFARPFAEYGECTAEEVLLYSDASGNFRKGFGAWCQNSWMFSVWSYEFMCKNDPSIEYLELFAVTAAVITWLHRFPNKHIYLFCDNESVCRMINNSSSSCRNCMLLLRLIVMGGLWVNTKVSARHVNTKDNGIADSLSRLDFKRFYRLRERHCLDQRPTTVPARLWPMEKLWIN